LAASHSLLQHTQIYKEKTKVYSEINNLLNNMNQETVLLPSKTEDKYKYLNEMLIIVIRVN